MANIMSRGIIRSLVAVLAAVALAGAAASCDDGGMYQGGSDTTPGWRK